MKLLSLFDHFESIATNESLSRAASRREAFSSLGRSLGKAVAVGLPVAAFLKPGRVMAQGNASDPIAVLNFALTLEYLEAEFYQMGLDADGLLDGDTRASIAQISKHETQHVEFLKSAISGAGGDPVDKPEFDFTAGGNFPNWNTDEATFLALAQAFEDTGVRAYKGQAANLMGSDDILTAALRIHSVEARHASMVRRMRGSKGWITNAMNTTAPAAAAVYAGEDNVMQLGVNAVDVTNVGKDKVTEAYDEPLSREAVLDIAGLFLA